MSIQVLRFSKRMLPVILILLMNFGLSNTRSFSAGVPNHYGLPGQEVKVFGRVIDKKTGEPIIGGKHNGKGHLNWYHHRY